MIIALIVLAGASMLLSLPLISDVLSVLYAVSRPSRRWRRYSRSRLLFLVPAHNEELLLGACIRSLRKLKYPRKYFRVMVVADNCTDRTCSIAAQEGAEFMERHDLTRPGKPQAISWALDRVLPSADVDAVVIVDADTQVDAEFARELTRQGPLNDCVVQPYNGVQNPGDSNLTRMAAVFARARFQFSFPLKNRAGLNIPLSNGMCIGTSVLTEHGWHAFSICEDWELYAQYTALGVRTYVAPEAILWSQEARSLDQSSSQRRRWTAGKLTVLVTEFMSIVASDAITMRQKLDAVAELTAPGPAVHLGSAMLLGGAIMFSVESAGWRVALLGLVVAGIARVAVYTILALFREPAPLRAIVAFLTLPTYAAWRLVIQLGALTKAGSRQWIRTDRHV